MANNVRISYTLPSVGNKQAPLAYVLIQARVSPQAPWADVAQQPVPLTDLVLTDVSPGQWFYQGFAVDANGQRSKNAASGSIDVPFDAPGDLTLFTVALVP
jgi:hypothetical protein